MERYGSDKPDLRFPMELVDVSDIVARQRLSSIHRRRRAGRLCQGAQRQRARRHDPPRDRRADRAGRAVGRERAWRGSSRRKRRSLAHRQVLVRRRPGGAAERRPRQSPATCCLFAADRLEVAAEILGRLRVRLGRQIFDLDANGYAPAWIVDWPLFHRDPETGKLDSRPPPVHRAGGRARRTA